MTKIKFFSTDIILSLLLTLSLLTHYLNIAPLGIDEVILIAVSAAATIPVVLSAGRALKNQKVTIDLLASIALVVSLLSRQWASAGFINLMLALARIFADYTKNNANSAIKSLLKLRPQKVKVERGKKILEEPIDRIRVNDLIVIESGDRIPVDGVVIRGEASVDQSSLTGESVPVAKAKGDKVFSLTLNVSGSLVIRAEKIGKDTTFEKIIELVDKSQEDKIEIETIGDKFAGWYIILSIAGSIILYLFSQNLNLVLSVLLVVCADDIAVANPLAFWAAIARAAKRGIIVKGGNFLEGLTKVKTMVVDKTGTLTKGKFKVTSITPFGKYQKEDVLKMAAQAEFFSEHPLAVAIINYARQSKINFEHPENFQEFAGRGSVALYRNKKIIAGNFNFLEENGVKISVEQREEFSQIQKNGLGVVLIGYGGRLAGCISLADEVRPGMVKAIEKLKTLGVSKWVMLTGDSEKIARRVARELAIENFHANLLPGDKIKFIKKYLNKNSKVAMVGDGVNDAASLALADVGIAMGAIGSDAAIESADIALMHDDFSKIPDAFELGRFTLKIAYQNFWIWGVVNVFGLALVFLRVIGPEGAAAYNFVTDLFPIINSMRVFRY